MVLGAFAALLSIQTQAAVMPTFEAALGSARQEVLAVRAEQKLAAKDALEAELPNMGRAADRLSWEASRLKNTMWDLRRRAQRHDRGSPGRPSSDPFLRQDISRAVWDLRDLARDAQNLRWRANSALARADKDPNLVSPAQSFVARAGRNRSDAGWLESEARWASFDLRRAGFSTEAWDIERLSQEAASSARSIESTAAQILARVTP